MHLWYPLLTSILCVVFYCEAQNKGSITKLHKGSLLKFFKLNSDLVTNKETTGNDNPSKNQTSNISEKRLSILNLSRQCEPNYTRISGNKPCTKKHKRKYAVKKSFRPHDDDNDDDDDDDDDEDYDDPRSEYDDLPDGEEFPEEAEDVRGSYRSYKGLPPRHQDSEPLYDDTSERYRDYEDEEDDRKAWRRHEFEDQPRDRPGYEDKLEDDRDDWDWEPPRRHHGRGRWPSRHHQEDDDESESSYYPRYQHHPRYAHYYRHQYGHPAEHASYRSFGQVRPLWPPYTQGYQSVSTAPTSAPYFSYPAGWASGPTGWTPSPAGQTSWQSSYLPTAASHLFNTVGTRVISPYLQNTFNYPQRETNSIVIPQSSHHVSSPAYFEATARNLVSFTSTLPGIAATLPRLSRSIYHYPRPIPWAIPRVVSHTRHLGGHLPGPFLRHSNFPDAILNRVRELNLH